MGTSQYSGDLKLTTVATGQLKERLNKIYDAMRRGPGHAPNTGLFEHLWELKEMALLEGRSHVQVPGGWLDELEHDISRDPGEAGRGH